MHFLVGLFGVFAVLLDLLVVTGFRSGYETPLMLYIGLAMGQLALLAFWCVSTCGIRTTRLLITLTAAALLSQPLGRVTGASWAEWFTLYCLFTASTGSLLLIASWCGVRPRILDTPSATITITKRGQRRFSQFSLGGLLSLMTLVAVGLGIYRHLTLPEVWGVAAASYGFWLVLIALATLWAITSRHALRPRLLLLVTLCLTAGWFMNQVEHQQSVWFFTNLVMLESLVICAGIAAVQVEARARESAMGEQPDAEPCARSMAVQLGVHLGDATQHESGIDESTVEAHLFIAPGTVRVENVPRFQ